MTDSDQVDAPPRAHWEDMIADETHAVFCLLCGETQAVHAKTPTAASAQLVQLGWAFFTNTAENYSEQTAFCPRCSRINR
ncbi:hypothetical protein [Glaciihabitans sp. dw_435]|uniref:hypothetical protein n=1 Tax=Glaciihabitans sp. dw_435 TaxID=2720081 RepID=UPI001BD58F4C|nr:hypothetical protein [Glaciihabitans sp. dw_435]